MSAIAIERSAERQHADRLVCIDFGGLHAAELSRSKKKSVSLFRGFERGGGGRGGVFVVKEPSEHQQHS